MSDPINPDLLQAIKNNEEAFLAIIRERLGIMIRLHQTSELLRAISSACEMFNQTPEEYLRSLKYSPMHSPVIDHLIGCITVGETYFFRDKKQMHLLEKLILPRIIAQKRSVGNLNLRIWSAACSTGEEIYTIAMMLKELLPDIKNWSLDLLGTDINKIFLEKGMAADYSQWSMRSIEDYYKNKYFQLENKRYHLLPDIKKMVKFFWLNLHDNSYPAILNGTSEQDLILCRNVMIYFDNVHISQIMQRFDACLKTNGYLLLGASDPLDIVDTSFKFCNEEEAIFLQKDNS